MCKGREGEKEARWEAREDWLDLQNFLCWRKELYHEILGRLLHKVNTHPVPYYFKIRFKNTIFPWLKMKNSYPSIFFHMEVLLLYFTLHLFFTCWYTVLIVEAGFSEYSNNRKYKFHDEIHTVSWCTCALLIAHLT